MEKKNVFTDVPASIDSNSKKCSVPRLCLDLTKYMVNYLVMIRVNVYEAKTNLSKYLKRLEKGEIIILCRRNEPVAEIRPISKQPDEQRPVGVHKGDFAIPPSFFEPLPKEVETGFYGQSMIHAAEKNTGRNAQANAQEKAEGDAEGDTV